MIRVPIVSTFNPKGLSTAEKAYKKFGQNIGRYLGVAALAKFGQVSLRAFGDNQKQIAILTNTLDNLGQRFRALGVNDFIDKLALASGVAKTELIPAFQGLFISLGNVDKAQAALRLAMDVSAGTGKDLRTVQIALSKAYLGNTTSLTRLGAGLSKTLLKTGDMQAISARLAATFSGDMAAGADTVSGKLDRLKEALHQAEIGIGGGLVRAFGELNGSKDFNATLDKIVQIGKNIGGLVVGIERAGKLASMLSIKNLLISPIGTIKDVMALQDKWAKSDAVGRRQYGGAAGVAYQKVADKATATKLSQQKKDELGLLKSKNVASAAELQQKKDQAALDALKAKFDLQRIGIADALAAATDADTRARLTAMLAILDGSAKGVSDASAGLIAAQRASAASALAAQLAADKLAMSLLLGTSGINTWIASLVASGSVVAGALLGKGSGGMSVLNQSPNNTGYPTAGLQSGVGGDAAYQALLALIAQQTAAITKLTTTVPTVTIVDNTSGLVSVVQDAIVQNNRLGNNRTVPGSLSAA